MSKEELSKIYFKTCLCISRDGSFIMGFHIRRNNHGIEYTVDLVSKETLSASTFKKSIKVKKVIQSEYLRRQLAAVAA